MGLVGKYPKYVPKYSKYVTSPLSLTLSLWTRSYLLPPNFASPCLLPFFNAAFPRPRDGVVASLCAAADYDPAREREDDNNDDDDYAWGGMGIVTIIRDWIITATAPSISVTV